MENHVQSLIEQIIETHYDIIWTANIKSATNIEEFEAWATMMAKSHAAATLRFMYSEDEFEKKLNDATDESA